MTDRWYQDLDPRARRTLWTAFAGFGLDAMDVQVYAFVLPTIMAHWRLDTAQAGALTSITLAASALGGAVAGRFADRVGRVRMLRATLLVFCLATAGCGLAMDPNQLLAARALQGLAFGGEWAIGAVLIAELAPAPVRGRMAGFAQSGWVVGWALAAGLAMSALALAPEGLGWRVAFLLGVIPAAVVYGLRRRLEEPEVFRAAAPPTAWRDIFRRDLWPTTLTGGLLAAGVHGAYWAIATWWPLLLVRHGFSAPATSGALALLLSGAFGGYLTGGWLSDRWGRRAMFAVFAAAGMGLVLGLGRSGAGSVPLLLISAPLGFIVLGMYSTIGSVLAELFPTELRGAGLGFCYNFGRGLAATTPLLVGAVAGGWRLESAIAAAVAGAYALVLLAVAILPETRGRDLNAIGQATG